MIFAVQTVALTLVIVTLRVASPARSRSTNGVVDSGSTVWAVMVNALPRTAVGTDVVIFQASARTIVDWDAPCVPFVAATTIR